MFNNINNSKDPNNKKNEKDDDFQNPNYTIIQDQYLQSTKLKLNEMQDTINNINRQALDLTKGPGNSSVYQRDNYYEPNLAPQNSNFYGSSFFASPTSPEYYPKNTNVNYYNLNQNTDNLNNFNTQYENNNFSLPTPKLRENEYLIHDQQGNVTNTSNISDSLENSNNINNINSPRQFVMQSPSQNYFPEGIEPKLQNIVSTANFKCQLDLREIALKAKNAEYNPKRFAAVIMRIREPKTTALIFASGKMVCTGARSEDESKTAAKQYARIIKKLGFPVKFSEFKIQNIVGSCDVKFPIRLEGLSNQHSRFCNYEPEMFPGLIYRMIKPKIVLLIFVSGKIVLTGAKERNDIFSAFKTIYPVLLSFKKKDTISTSAEQTSNTEEL